MGSSDYLSNEDCFCTVTKIPRGIFLLPGDNSVTSRGNVAGSGSGLEDLDRESIAESADDGMSLGMGRLTIGKTGGGERPCGSGGEGG